MLSCNICGMKVKPGCPLCLNCALATDFSLTGLNNGHFPLIHIPAFPVNFIILNDAIQNLNAKQ